MARDKGWITLHRKITDSAIWNCGEKFDKRSAWIDLLLMANHEDKELIINGKLHIIKKGQHWTSYKKLADRWGWDKKTVYRFFVTLRNSEMATVSATQKGTLITIVNWALYQDFRNTNSTTKRTADATSKGISDAPSEGTQTTMINNDITMRNNKGGASGKVRQ